MTDKATNVSPEEPSPDGVFSSRLRSALGKRSGTWLARQIDAAPSTVNDWLRGASEPTLSRLVLAAQVLGVSVQWLAVGEEESNPPGFKPVMVEVALDRLEATVKGEDVPIAQEALSSRPDLEGARRQLIEISNDPSIIEATRARADLILDLAFGDTDAVARRRERELKISERVRAAHEACAVIVEQMGWSPPALTMMAIQNRMAFGDLSSADAKEVLDALRRDLRRMEENGA